MRLMPKSFAFKLTLAYLGVFLFVSLISAWFFSVRLERQTIDHLQESVLQHAFVVRNAIPVSSIEAADRSQVHARVIQLSKDLAERITVVNAEGLVLGDSERSWDELLGMDNHRNRPEIKAALSGRIGTSIRYSNTLDMYLLYAGIPVEQDGRVVGAIRIAKPLKKVHQELVAAHRPIYLGALTGMIFVILMGLWIGRRTNRRIQNMARSAVRYAGGDLSERIIADGDDELKILTDAMNQMASVLRQRIVESEEEKAKVSVMLENMTEGVMAVNGQKKILAANSSIQKIFAVNVSAVFEKSLIEVVKNKKIDELVGRAIREEGFCSDEVELTHLAGKTLRINAAGIRGGAGGVRGIVVFYDVTDIRRLEKMRRDFVANVSHELRTPLTSLKGFVETLLDGAMNDRERCGTFLKMMQEDAERLCRLIDDILDLSRLDSRQLILKQEAVDLGVAVQSALDAFQPSLRGKNLCVENQIPVRPSLQVWADPDRLRQVLLNLLDNAVKFNRSSGKITLSAYAEGGFVKTTIADTGIGISPGDIPHIFERFFRVDKARSRDLGGTGLGLSIVKHIVETHGGTVFCQSELGVGSAFVFTLPMEPFPKF